MPLFVCLFVWLKAAKWSPKTKNDIKKQKEKTHWKQLSALEQRDIQSVDKTM